MNSFHSRGRRPRPERQDRPAPTHGHGRVRADLLLVEQGLAESRSAARRLIEAGRVMADGESVAKVAHELAPSARLEVLPDDEDRYVSRGGIKLAGALARCRLDVRARTCLDVGQSTGGFTDCLLQAGATRVVGVEVGHHQLHPRLAADPRVVSIEGLNARALSGADLGPAMPAGGFDLLVCDASFISLTLLIPCWPALLAPKGEVLALVKPQFEVGPQGLGKGGIVRGEGLYPGVEAAIRSACEAAGLQVQDYFESPIRGGDGNREFFIYACPATSRDASGNPP